MTLLINERILTTFNNGLITLITHRLIYESKGFQSAESKSIMLEHITLCESNTTATININVDVMERSNILAFINKIEQAKSERLIHIN